LARYRLLASGSATASAAELLTAPYARRIRQIELTLERWRWLPTFTSPPIIVNVPQFRLFAFQSTRDRKAEILQMDVIVGRTYPRLQTPVFTADLKYVIFRPFWDVPYSITQREMLPQIRANPNYLRKERVTLVSSLIRTPVVIANQGEDTSHALERMRTHGVRRLPVVSDAGTLVGIITVDDLLKRLAADTTALVDIVSREQTHEQHTRR
jgi:CBS domain-containing protein